MKFVSLSVGLPREVEVHCGTVLTAIFKAPVDRRLRVTALNFRRRLTIRPDGAMPREPSWRAPRRSGWDRAAKAALFRAQP
jgi:hypothetical protein